MHAYMIAARRAALLPMLAFAAACSDGSTAPAPLEPGNGNPPPGQQPPPVNVPPARTIASVELTGASEVVAGYQGQVQATARAQDGSVVETPFNWGSSDPAIASIDAHGSITARAVGTVTITASVGARSASRQVTVVPRLATRLQITAPTRELQRGDEAYFGVVVLDQHGQLIVDAPWALRSSDPSIVEVVDRHVKPVRAGAATVTITSGNAVATALVRVAAETRYPLREVNHKALPAVMLETVEPQQHGSTTRQLVLVEGLLTLSNSGDGFTQRTVMEEWVTTVFQGSTIRSKVATHVQTQLGRYTIDATGHTVLHPTEGAPVIGTTVGMYGLRLVDYQQAGTWIYEFWR